MKATFLALLVMGTFASGASSAAENCTVFFPKEESKAYRASFISHKFYQKMVSVLEDKGYQVVQSKKEINEDPSYKLFVSGIYGYGCSHGLTNSDYLKVPSQYSVKFTGAADNVSTEGHVEAPPLLGSKTLSKKKIMQTLRSIPECK